MKKIFAFILVFAVILVVPVFASADNSLPVCSQHFVSGDDFSRISIYKDDELAYSLLGTTLRLSGLIINTAGDQVEVDGGRLTAFDRDGNLLATAASVSIYPEHAILGSGEFVLFTAEFPDVFVYDMKDTPLQSKYTRNSVNGTSPEILQISEFRFDASEGSGGEFEVGNITRCDVRTSFVRDSDKYYLSSVSVKNDTGRPMINPVVVFVYYSDGGTVLKVSIPQNLDIGIPAGNSVNIIDQYEGLPDFGKVEAYLYTRETDTQ